MALERNFYRAKLSLLAACALASLIVPAAYAQEAQPPATTQSTPAAQDDTAPSDETIVVTGSRIPRPDFAFSNPVVSIDARSIEYSGVTDVTSLMERIPALVNSMDSNDSSGSNAFIGGTGLNLLNLRNLGTNRTLVLVDGQRHVAALPGDTAVDTNTIPIDLIERVEVLTGGASAIYGADGVSGVVNFIMRDNFEGIRARVQAGDTERGGADNLFGSLTLGRNFDNNRGNIAVAVDYNHDSVLRSRDRSFTSAGTVTFAQPPASLNSPFDSIPFTNLRWFQSGTGGAIDADADFNADFDGNTGGAWDNGTFPDGIQSGTYQQGGSGTPVGGYFGDVLPEITRASINLFGHYDLTPHITVFTEMKFVDTKSRADSQPTFDFFEAINPDNFFLAQHPDILAAAAGNGADVMSGGLLPDGTVLVTRDNFDFGLRGEDVHRETFRGVWGLRGDLPADWGTFNVTYNFGSTDVDNIALNNRFNDRFAAALDVVDDGAGNPVCRSNLDPTALGLNVDWQGWAAPTSFTPGPNSGCAPINIFGNGSPSQAALDWIMTDSLDTSRVTQSVFNAYITGNFDHLIQLPAGAIGYSIGAEWRRETSEDTPAIEDQLGLTFNNIIAPSSGAIEVKEYFAEINVPVLRNAPFAETLSFDAAERYSQYSTIGNTNTWKVGAVWAPISDIRFRATRARAVRAPNIGELFGPASQTFLFVTDPCDINNLQFGTPNRVANCAAVLGAAGADPATFEDPNVGVNIPGTQSGNADLQEETADTTTFGVVVRPSFLRRLTFSIDYYDIDLQNAINTLSPQDLADQCVDLPTINNEFCAAIERQTGGIGAGGIVGFSIQPVNVASFTTKGIDFSLAYSLNPADFGVQDNWGTFDFRIVGNHLDELTFVNLPGAPPDPDKGELGAPEWQATFDVTWNRGPWTVNYNYVYWSPTERFSTSSVDQTPLSTPPQFREVDAYSVHNAQVRFSPTDRWTIYAGVNNLFDQLPDVGLGYSSYPVGPEGRSYYVGFTANFGPNS